MGEAETMSGPMQRCQTLGGTATCHPYASLGACSTVHLWVQLIADSQQAAAVLMDWPWEPLQGAQR